MRFGRTTMQIVVFSLGLLAGGGVALLVVHAMNGGDPAPATPPLAARRPAPLEDEAVRIDRALETTNAAHRPADSPVSAAGGSIRETDLPLRLLGTLVVDPADRSQAVILDVEAVRHMVLSEGDPLPSHPAVTLHAIEPRRVLLETERGLEMLWLSEGDGLPDVAAATEWEEQGTSAMPRDRPLRSTAELRRNRSVNVSPEVIEAMNALAAHLVQDLEPIFDANGRIEGVRAMSIADAGLLEQAGIEQDEIIRGVNGVVIDTPEAASRVLRDLASCEPVMGMVDGPMGGREVEIGVELLSEFGCVPGGGSGG